MRCPQAQFFGVDIRKGRGHDLAGHLLAGIGIGEAGNRHGDFAVEVITCEVAEFVDGKRLVCLEAVVLDKCLGRQVVGLAPCEFQLVVR